MTTRVGSGVLLPQETHDVQRFHQVHYGIHPFGQSAAQNLQSNCNFGRVMCIYKDIYVCVGISIDGFKSLMENTIKLDDLGVPLAFETSIYIYIFSGD